MFSINMSFKRWTLFFCFFAGGCSQSRQPRYLFGGDYCGQTIADVDVWPRISGGRNVSEGEMPWMVRLNVSFLDDNKETCGGFILNENWVITAAHCLSRVVSVRASAGRISYDWISNNEQVMVIPNSNFYLHPQHNELTMENDIGLIHMPQSLRFNQYVKPICVHDVSSCDVEPPGNSNQVDFCLSNITSAGWGLAGAAGSVSNYLKAVDMKIVPRDQCQRQYPPSRILPQHICAKGQQPGGDTCPGDSGGLYFQNQKAVAVGIISFGPHG